MRQVGKSTLLKRFATTYRTFDDDAFLRDFDNEKSILLEHSPGPIALDEIQKYPPAFDALKLSIDRKKRMGRFLVSGSVRFSSRKQIRESLTGRIVLLELFPLSLAECHNRGINPLLKMIHSVTLAKLLETLNRKNWITKTQRDHYLRTGGLPGICFRRDEAVRTELYAQHLDTLLRRDIHLVRQVRLSFTQLRGLLTAVAGLEGLPVNLSHLARLTGCSMPTVKTVLEALEGLFLVRSYGKTWFIEDLGLSHYLRGNFVSEDRISLVRSAYHELRLQYYLHARNDAIMKPYVTRGGIDVPFFFEFKDGTRLAILIDAGESPSEKSLKSVAWLKKRFPRFKALILTATGNGIEISKDCISMPLNWIY